MRRSAGGQKTSQCFAVCARVAEQQSGVVVRGSEEARRVERDRFVVVLDRARKVTRSPRGRQLDRTRATKLQHRTCATEVRVSEHRFLLILRRDGAHRGDHATVLVHRGAVIAGSSARLCRGANHPRGIEASLVGPCGLCVCARRSEGDAEHRRGPCDTTARARHGFLGAATPPAPNDADAAVYSCRCTLVIFTVEFFAFWRKSVSEPERSRQRKMPISQL